MFTIEQIKQAHAKVKSGADFPAYVQELKALGICNYVHDVADGHMVYHGAGGAILKADAKWPARLIARQSMNDKLQQSLRTHQQGKTNYHEFCMEAAEAGVEKWVVDLQAMTCTYYDMAGQAMLVEAIRA